MTGRKYTFCKGSRQNAKLSKIDRFLVCKKFVDLSSDACCTTLPRYLSNHSPIILATNPMDFGPIQFCFLIHGWTKKGLEEVTKDANDRFVPSESALVQLVQKLKIFKEKVKLWVKDTIFKESEVKQSLISNLFHMEEIIEEMELNEEEAWVYYECKSGLMELEAHISRDLRKKSRSKWASFGDDNSKYFHGIIRKEIRSGLHGMEVNGVWCDNPKITKKEALKFFASRFKEEKKIRPQLKCYNIK
ncbi:uncharacterized protein LOC110924979 [Helianthus annuus]|uniref:uncharacterized protein LOC110924979 n=1 Tax=Helianthus annuus TaxID=4232 RepID=UPI000B8F300F|nr:uncharacterized protein LOC110924979 [Helianthus annuus]